MVSHGDTTRYIRNRMTQASVTAGGTTTVLAQHTYDGYSAQNVLRDGPAVAQHDSGNYGVGFPYRGNVTTRVAMGVSSTISYEITGAPYKTTDATGRTIEIATTSATGYSLPETLTPGGNGNLATSITYANSFAVTSVTGPNAARSTTTYDNYGRPQTTSIPDGAQTSYTYTYNPNVQTATLGDRWTKTTQDGFGRTVKVETGHHATTVSVAETEYAPCACSPLGKVWRTSRPHSPGSAAAWTTYRYDGMGRTLTVTAPDGSATQYLYAGATVRVTDAAGKWKKFTNDAMGNLVQVTEPNPGGGEYVTSYTYN